MPNLIELAQRLHEEKLFVKSEQDTILKLNEQVRLNAEKLSHSFWITRHHYLNLHQLISKLSSTNPAACSRRANELEKIEFVDAHDELGYDESSRYARFFESFINNPTLAAACLTYGDKLSLENTSQVAQIIVLGCYGNSIIADDHKHLLELLESLMLIQIAEDDQPRRLVQKGRCAFSVVYNLFAESLLPGKLFLMSALHEPIMKVLMEQEMWLETDEQKMVESVGEAELERRLGGKRGSRQFGDKLQALVKENEVRLGEVCTMFVTSLVNSMSLFPQSLGWVIARAYHIVKDAGNVSQHEAKALSADFLLQHFICPAIVDPERYGITGNLPVNSATRNNLMQVAQILQMAAHDTTATPVNSSFDQTNLVKRRMKELIDVVISTCNNEGVPRSRNMHGHITSAIFLTSTQIAHVVLFLRQIQLSNVHGVDQTSLAKILSYLPNKPPPPITKATNSILQTSVANNVQVQDDLGVGVGGSAHKSPHHYHQQQLQTSKQQPASASSASSTSQMSSSPSGRKLFAKSNSKHHHHHQQHNDTSVGGSSGGGGGVSNSADEDSVLMRDDKVLVLSVNIGDDNQTCDQPPGMMSEQQVVDMYAAAAAAKRGEGNNDDDNSISFGDTSATRKQFSVYLESSNISEIGEIADGTSQLDGSGSQSGRSGSSIDLDQVGDQVGDDASSFIAGGSSSHGGNHDDDDDNDDDEADDLESVKRSSNDEALKDLRRKIPTSRESIEDKMRKFEIGRKSRGGEVASTSGGAGGGGVAGGSGSGGGVQQNSDARSETWSVDVYASDSEQNNDDHHIRRSSASMGSLLQQQQPPHQPPQPLGGAGNPPHGSNNASSVAPSNQQQQANNSAVGGGDVDSRSDIWSVEVLASDGEPPSVDYRLNELDEDDDVTTRSRGSRASTPGLSAASGYSAVSGLSLVSDQNKSEPFSSLTPLVAGASSSGQQQQATTSHNHDDSSNGGDQQQQQQQSSNSNNKNKSVAWNLPTTSKSSGDMTSLVGLEMAGGGGEEESGGRSGTIKRSPYKRASSTNNNATVQKKPPPPQQVRHAWMEQQDFAVPSEGAQAADIDVREFDPLAAAAAASSFNTALQPTTKPINNNETQQNTTEQPTTTVVNTPLQQQAPRNHPTTTSTKSSSGVAIERKKSSSSPWWKTHKFGKSMRSGKHGSSSSSKQVSRSSSDVSANNDLLMMVNEDEKATSSSAAAPGEDIMEKYMRKMTTTPQQKTASKSTNYDGTLVEVDSKAITDAENNNSSAPPATTSGSSSSANNNNAWQQQQHNSNTSTSSKKNEDQMYGTKEEVRNDVKRKLRIVLSMAQPSSASSSSSSSSSFASQHNNLIVFSASSLSSPAHNNPPTTPAARGKDAQVKIRDEILSLVQAQLSQALVLQDRERVAQLSEVKRCVRNIDNSQCEVVYSELWRDYNRRSPYIAYLIRTKQHLLTACSYFKSVEKSIDNDKAVCRRYFTHQCVRLFLKSRDQRVEIFQRQFSRLVASDDKVNKIGEFLRELYGHLVADRVWQGTSEEVFNEAKFSIERYLFTTVYNTAMFPNQEADISRDQLFSEHIARLQESITPQHQALQISERFLSECPWKEAQVEAQSTVTYVTPRDKLRAATRCCKTIMYLLKIADENQVPGADDFTPVLVYVLIMANPRHLLSTIQFVRSYIGDELCGEDSYWWMQFTAATQFIKTI